MVAKRFLEFRRVKQALANVATAAAAAMAVSQSPASRITAAATKKTSVIAITGFCMYEGLKPSNTWRPLRMRISTNFVLLKRTAPRNCFDSSIIWIARPSGVKDGIGLASLNCMA